MCTHKLPNWQLVEGDQSDFASFLFCRKPTCKFWQKVASIGLRCKDLWLGTIRKWFKFCPRWRKIDHWGCHQNQFGLDKFRRGAEKQLVSLQITFCRLDHMYGILLAGVGGREPVMWGSRQYLVKVMTLSLLLVYIGVLNNICRDGRSRAQDVMTKLNNICLSWSARVSLLTKAGHALPTSGDQHKQRADDSEDGGALFHFDRSGNCWPGCPH